MENSRLHSQASHYTQAIAEVFYSVLQKSVPLDKELKHYFRTHPECGGNDRNKITESCFALFRWYGWLRQVLPGGLPEKPYESLPFCHGLAAALWLEHQQELPFFVHLTKHINLDCAYLTPAPDDLKGKMKGLGHFFKIRKLNISLLVPDWFIQELPDDTDLETLIVSLQTRPPTWIRAARSFLIRVTEELKQQELDFEAHPQCPNALKVLAPKFKTSSLETFQAGGFEIQDFASQCIGLACQARAGEAWWDVCAGAGGKSLQIADETQGQGMVTATDIREASLKQLAKRAKRARLENIKIEELSAVCASPKLFDGVLVDAPCSCTGVWRRNPGLKWTTDAASCAMSARTQMELCAMAEKKVKPGGILVYATCSLSVRENEDVVEAFLKQNPHFQLSRFVNPLTGKTVKGMLRVPFQPFDNDGMFVARLIRKNRVRLYVFY